MLNYHKRIFHTLILACIAVPTTTTSDQSNEIKYFALLKGGNSKEETFNEKYFHIGVLLTLNVRSNVFEGSLQMGGITKFKITIFRLFIYENDLPSNSFDDYIQPAHSPSEYTEFFNSISRIKRKNLLLHFDSSAPSESSREFPVFVLLLSFLNNQYKASPKIEKFIFEELKEEKVFKFRVYNKYLWLQRTFLRGFLFNLGGDPVSEMPLLDEHGFKFILKFKSKNKTDSKTETGNNLPSLVPDRIEMDTLGNYTLFQFSETPETKTPVLKNLEEKLAPVIAQENLKFLLKRSPSGLPKSDKMLPVKRSAVIISKAGYRKLSEKIIYSKVENRYSNFEKYLKLQIAKNYLIKGETGENSIYHLKNEKEKINFKIFAINNLKMFENFEGLKNLEIDKGDTDKDGEIINANRKLKWWEILLIVLGVILILGVIGLIWMLLKKRGVFEKIKEKGVGDRGNDITL